MFLACLVCLMGVQENSLQVFCYTVLVLILAVSFNLKSLQYLRLFALLGERWGAKYAILCTELLQIKKGDPSGQLDLLCDSKHLYALAVLSDLIIANKIQIIKSEKPPGNFTDQQAVRQETVGCRVFLFPQPWGERRFENGSYF